MVPGCHTDHDHGNAKACQQLEKAFPITVEWLVVPNFKSLNVENWGFPMGFPHVFPKCVLRQVLISRGNHVGVLSTWGELSIFQEVLALKLQYPPQLEKHD